MRFLALVYGLISYAVFLGVFLYLVGFLANFLVPKSIDRGPASPFASALVIDLLLIGLFGVHHSLAARPTFKRWWTQFVPQPIERSTYVLVASLILALVMWQWRPLPSVLWDVPHPLGRGALWGLYGLGLGLILYASFLIDHFDLFGLRQVVLYFRGREYTPAPFVMPTLYKFIRHPLMLGWLIAFWATPTMSVGHLVFALGNSIYIFCGIFFEERNLAEFHGEEYRQYRQRTSMLLPLPRNG